MILWNNS